MDLSTRFLCWNGFINFLVDDDNESQFITFIGENINKACGSPESWIIPPLVWAWLCDSSSVSCTSVHPYMTSADTQLQHLPVTSELQLSVLAS